MPKELELTDVRFGRLTAKVIDHHKRQNYWKCLCDCGKTTVVGTRDLRSGNTKSCGCLRKMPQSDNIVDCVFASLRVIARAPTIKKKAFWKCQCICGNYVLAMGRGLRVGDITSCGCVRRARCRTMGKRLPKGESSFNQIYINYQRQARIRGYDFQLTKEQFRALTIQNCFYCGVAPYQVHQGGPTKRLNGPYVYNGIDRQNNDLGYSADNCVSCCGPCNKMKKHRTVEQFLKVCDSIAETQKKRAEELLRLSLPKLVNA